MGASQGQCRGASFGGAVTSWIDDNLNVVIGIAAGGVQGYFGGWTDRIVGRIADTIMAFPLFVLAMGIVAALGNTVQNIIIATAIVNFPLYARVARAEANVRRNAGFVQAARLSGNGEYRILLGHILPNIMPIMIVQMSLTMGYAILNAAGLSFIGLGVRPPTAEWGIMVAEGAGFFEVVDVAQVHDVEAAVGEDDLLAMGTGILDGDQQLIEAQHATFGTFLTLHGTTQLRRTDGSRAELADDDAGRDRQHILGRAADLDAAHV